MSGKIEVHLLVPMSRKCEVAVRYERQAGGSDIMLRAGDALHLVVGNSWYHCGLTNTVDAAPEYVLPLFYSLVDLVTYAIFTLPDRTRIYMGCYPYLCASYVKIVDHSGDGKAETVIWGDSTVRWAEDK